jgi:hypothetical protein
MYQMLVGEIGITRQEFLYVLKFWEIILIIRGYFCRHHSGWEQARLIAYNAAHCMGGKHQPPPITSWLKFPWEKECIDLPSNDEIEEIRRNLQQQNAKKK